MSGAMLDAIMDASRLFVRPPRRYVATTKVERGRVLRLSAETMAVNARDILTAPLFGPVKDSTVRGPMRLFDAPVVFMGSFEDEEYLWSVDPDAAMALADWPEAA